MSGRQSSQEPARAALAASGRETGSPSPWRAAALESVPGGSWYVLADSSGPYVRGRNDPPWILGLTGAQVFVLREVGGPGRISGRARRGAS